MPPEDDEIEPDFELAAELEVGLTEEQLLDTPLEPRSNGDGQNGNGAAEGQRGEHARAGKNGTGRDAA